MAIFSTMRHATSEAVLFLFIAFSFNPSAAKCGENSNGAQCLRQLLQAEPLITGGEDSSAYRFPYVASVISKNSDKSECGGALIGPGLVLTAAQCVNSNSDENSFPDVHLSHHGDEQVFQTCKIIIHEDYTGDPASGNDIALLLLAEESTSITVLEGRPFKPKSVSSVDLTALQWTEGQSVRAIGMEIVGSEKCDDVSEGGVDGERMICTQPVVEGSCHDRIGGPIVAIGDPDKGYPDELIGILSLGNCGKPEAPHAYTSISRMLDWISTLGTASSSVRFNPECEVDKEGKLYSNRGGRLPIVPEGLTSPDAQTISALIEDGDFKSAASLIVLAALTKDGPKILADVAQRVDSKEHLISASRAFVFSLDGLEELLSRPMTILSQEFSKKDISARIDAGDLTEAAMEVAELTKIDGVEASTVMEEVATEEVAGGRTVDMGVVLIDAINEYDGKEQVLNPAIDVVLEDL